MSVPGGGPKSKAWGRGAAYPLLVLVFILSISAAFGLGYLAGREAGEGSGEDRLWIEDLSKQEALQPAAAAVAQPAVVAGTYVASKSGTKYHLPTCPGAKQIREGNKVWFETKEAAEAAGYTPAANCPGL